MWRARIKRSIVLLSAVLLLQLGGQTSATTPCSSSQIDVPSVVEDTAGATQLAVAVNCSGGSFDVEWAGSVIVKETIRLFGGTILNITGTVDGTSVLNGENGTPLFEVESATLHLHHLTLTNGTGGSGGAIYAADAFLSTASCRFLSNTGVNGGALFLENSRMVSSDSSFAGNSATEAGGAMCMWASNVTVGAVEMFENNKASSGGALFVDGRSMLTLAGDDIFFARNAAQYGGGIFLYYSTSNVTGAVELFNNTAEYGGAVYADNSSLLVIGDLLLSTNFASASGGAVVADASTIDVSGTIVWENNSANDGGGGLKLWKTGMHVQALGEVSFTGNTAEYGGAAYTSTSTLLVDGDVLFAENVAIFSGGGLYSDLSKIDISGNACWESNRSPGDGGGLRMWKSNISLQRAGTAVFVGNHAGVGGAAFIYDSVCTAYGHVSFSDNFASANGGALYAAGLSVVNITTSLWANNTALGWGGALVTSSSKAFMQTSGNTLFINNSAGSLGGAVYVDNSTLLFGGAVTFEENVVDVDGGAVYSDFSAVTIAGTAVWKNNSAGGVGGGLLLSNSSMIVPHSGTAKFMGNGAESGGATFFYRSTISLDGDVFFGDNLATDLGGATFIQLSDLNVTGNSTWQHNICANAGGGVAMLKSTLRIVAGSNGGFLGNEANIGGGIFVDETAAVFVAGRASFVHNVAVTGAGIKMGTFSSASFTGGAVTMLGNEASSSGGGIHCESPTKLNLDGVKFESNYGGVSGGAMTTLLAGTERVAETEAKPAILTNCLFSENTAGDAGGALFIGGGFVEISGSYFYNNTAGRSGGAVLASGIVGLDDCAFVENHAVVGSAVMNTVSVSLSFVDFVNNTLLCDNPGLFLDWNDTSSFELACESCVEDCNNCTVESPNRGQECQPVLEHTTSDAANGGIELLNLQQGFWRSSGTSRDVRECYENSACVGGTEGYCNEGYEGPLCAVCADGYSGGLGYACSQCNEERRSATIAVAAVVLVAVVAIVAQGLRFLGTYAGRTVAGEAVLSGNQTGVQSLFTGARASQALKVVVVSWQIVTQFTMVASVTYPDVYNAFLKYVNVVNLNLGWMLSAGCLVDTDFYDNLLVSTIAPLVIFGMLAASHKAASSRNSDRQTRSRISNRHASAVFWLSFLVYAGVSAAVFQTFACVDFDNGLSYLRADHSIQCYSTKHTLFRVYAGVMGVVYPFGIPFCYAIVLYRGRTALKDTVARETITPDDGVARDLWVAYKPEVYFYEVVECARRVVLSGVVVFVLPNTAGQIAVSFLLALFFAAVLMVLDPYTSWFDTWTARTGHTIVLMSMFVALLQKVNTEEDDGFSQDVFAIVLVVSNCVMVVAAGAEACGMCLVTVREIRQPVPTLKTAASASSALDDTPSALGEDVEQPQY